MPQGRMLNRRISIDEELAKLSKEAIILYTWCIPHLDCEGKILADAPILKGTVVPYIRFFTNRVINRCVDELGTTPQVVVYGKEHKYMKFLGFEKNQNINKEREAPSEIPNPTQEELQSNSRLTPAKVKLSKDKLSKGNHGHLSDDQFLKILKTNPAYKHIDLDNELFRMDAWLLTHKGRQKTRRFIINWLNKIDRPLNPQQKPIKKPNPKCDVCGGTGYVKEGDKKGAHCFCW